MTAPVRDPLAPPPASEPAAAAASPPAATWHPVARTAELRGDGPFAVTAGGADLVLLRARGEWRAYEGLCPHQGALLGEGELDDGELVCRNHRWRFDGATGQRR